MIKYKPIYIVIVIIIINLHKIVNINSIFKHVTYESLVLYLIEILLWCIFQNKYVTEFIGNRTSQMGGSESTQNNTPTPGKCVKLIIIIKS